MTDSVTTGAAVFELARFEWAKPDRIEIEGTWSGVRGRRFIRPTLVLRGENGEHLRLLATLEHKPWAADDGIAFIAAFKFDGEGPIKFASADLNVAPGLDLELPAPRMRAGNPRRFRPRIEAHDATAGDAERRAAAAAAAGIVTEVPAPADPVTPDIDPPAPAVDPPQPDPDPGPNVDPAPNVDPPHPDPDSAAARGDLAPATSEAELDRLRAARDAMRRERDSALDKLRAVRKELEAERQAREDAVAEARASERASANSMLSQGAELRAAVERQRALAYEARDEAQQQRDNAIAARERATAERDEAFRQRKEAERARDAAQASEQRAHAERDRALGAKDKALQELARANEERDEALKERDSVVSIHERGLPVIPPKPRFVPGGEEPPSQLEVWMPRGIALGILGLFALIVLRLFAGV